MKWRGTTTHYTGLFIQSGKSRGYKAIPTIAGDIQLITDKLLEDFPSLQTAGISFKTIGHSYTHADVDKLAMELRRGNKRTDAHPLVSLAVVYNLEDALAAYREKAQN